MKKFLNKLDRTKTQDCILASCFHIQGDPNQTCPFSNGYNSKSVGKAKMCLISGTGWPDSHCFFSFGY